MTLAVISPSLLISIQFENPRKHIPKIVFTADFLPELSFDSMAEYACRMAYPNENPNDYISTFAYQLQGVKVKYWIAFKDNKGLEEAMQRCQQEGRLFVSASIVKKSSAVAPLVSSSPSVHRFTGVDKARIKQVAAKKVSTTKYKTPSMVRNVPVSNSVERKILTALKRYLECNVTAPDRIMIAIQSGYKNLGSSAFSNAMKSLLSSNWIEYPDKDTVRLTKLGLTHVGPLSPHRTKDNKMFQQSIRIKLEPLPLKIFDRLLDGSTLREEEVKKHVGYPNVYSKAFSESISKLKALRLLEFPKQSAKPWERLIRLSNNAFPCGRPVNGDDVQAADNPGGSARFMPRIERRVFVDKE